MAKRFLDDANLTYETIVADQEPEKAREYGIRNAPTLVAGSEKYSGLSAIRQFVDAN